MGRSRISTVLVAVTAAAVVTVPTVPGAAAVRQDPPEIVSIEVTPRVDVAQGWGTATVAVHVRHAVGLPDAIHPASSDNYNMVTAGGERGFPRAGTIAWPRLDRVSGTATDGVWQSTVRLSPAWNGAYPVTQVQLTDRDSEVFYLPVTNGPVVTVGGGEVWSVVSVRNPVRVVTGDERWRPQARVTNTVTGRPVGGARVRSGSVYAADWPRFSQTTEPGTAADAAGLWTSPVTYGVQDRLEARNFGYGGRGGRGWSLQGIGCDDITVKLQGSSVYADTTLAGDQPLVVTGNVWPAPAILDVGAQALLQGNFGAAGWQTLATSSVRYNGRYTLTWYPLQPGTYEVRVRIPGNGGAVCTTGTVGTTLAGTTVRAAR